MTDIDLAPARRGRPPAAEVDRRVSLSRAEARLKEIEKLNDGLNSEDPFAMPEPPDGFEYELKRKTIYGQEDPTYAVELIRQGWEPVPLSRHAEMMPHGWSGETIERGGNVLMERPKVLCERSRNRDKHKTEQELREKEIQLGVAPRGQFDRSSARVRKTFEPMAVTPDE